MSLFLRWIWRLTLALVLVSPVPAFGQSQEIESAEALVRARYYEGLPYSGARLLRPAGVERLIQLLRDPSEGQVHANVVMALGMSGAPQAYAALVEFDASAPTGEVDGAEYRARRAIPLAMGHLAREDPRALQFLTGAARGETAGGTPRWRFRHLGDRRLQRVLRRAAISGLGISGRQEALAVLEELRRNADLEPTETEELRAHIREVRRLGERIRQQGPDRVFGVRSSR
jgi:HEAT repeat protein